jgi:hypothetical protein
MGSTNITPSPPPPPEKNLVHMYGEGASVLSIMRAARSVSSQSNSYPDT